MKDSDIVNDDESDHIDESDDSEHNEDFKAMNVLLEVFFCLTHTFLFVFFFSRVLHVLHVIYVLYVLMYTRDSTQTDVEKKEYPLGKITGGKVDNSHDDNWANAENISDISDDDDDDGDHDDTTGQTTLPNKSSLIGRKRGSSNAVSYNRTVLSLFVLFELFVMHTV